MSFRDLEELLAERGIEVDHVTLYRWVQRFTPLLIDAARPRRHLAGDRWFVDKTYVKVCGVWSYLYWAVDQHGQVIDVYVCQRRDIASARMFVIAALDPAEVITDRAPALANVMEDLVPAAWHNTGQPSDETVPQVRLSMASNRTTQQTPLGHQLVQAGDVHAQHVGSASSGDPVGVGLVDVPAVAVGLEC